MVKLYCLLFLLGGCVNSNNSSDKEELNNNDGLDQNIQVVLEPDSLIIVSETEIDNSKWVNYLGETNEYHVILSLKGLDEQSMNYSFQLFDKEGVLYKELNGVISRKPKYFTTIPVRFETKVSGAIFEDKSSHTAESARTSPYQHSIRATIEKNTSRYASFFFQIRGDILFFPELIRTGADEPYERYLVDLLKPIQETKNYLTHYRNTQNQKEKEKEFETKYLELLNDLTESLELLSSKDIQYDFKKDTSLTDLAQYYELDAVIEIFKQYNINFSTDPIQSSPLWVERNFENTLALTYILTQSGKIKDTSIEILPSSHNSHEENRKIGTISYYAKNKSFTDYEHFILGKLYRYGGSTATTMLTIWKAEKDMMKLDYVLGSISEDYGTPKIDTLISLNNGKKLFLGQQWGGDGGDVWGSFWIREWTESNELKILIERKMGGSETYRNEITYSFLNDSAIELINTAKYEQNEIYLDSLISRETLNLLEL